MARRTAADVLRQMIALIKERGWIQGRGASPKGFCVWGALFEVAPTAHVTRNEVSDFIAEVIGASGHGTSISSWNDRNGRTKRQVLSALNKAVKLAEARR